jgi:lysozyme
MLRQEVEATQGPALPWLSLANLTEEAGALFGGAIATEQAARNVAAFLAMIRRAEGTDRAADPYRVLFGGGTWLGSMADHPRRAVQFTDKAGRRLWTTAAGAYQFLAVSMIPGGGSTRVDTWDRLARKLSLPDFGPESQDRAAVELIDEAGALLDVQAGRFDAAVSKVRRIWASLPGAGHDQPERSLSWARAAYADAGGVFA